MGGGSVGGVGAGSPAECGWKEQLLRSAERAGGLMVSSGFSAAGFTMVLQCPDFSRKYPVPKRLMFIYRSFDTF